MILPILVGKTKPESIFEEVYEEISQWAIIEGISTGMFSKECMLGITSILGKPLHGEYLDTNNHKHALRVCFMAD